MTWPLSSEAGGDLVLEQTSLFLLCKSSCSNAKLDRMEMGKAERSVDQSKVNSSCLACSRRPGK